MPNMPVIRTILKLPMKQVYYILYENRPQTAITICDQLGPAMLTNIAGLFYLMIFTYWAKNFNFFIYN
jgi:hypothetical protein